MVLALPRYQFLSIQLWPLSPRIPNEKRLKGVIRPFWLWQMQPSAENAEEVESRKELQRTGNNAPFGYLFFR